MMRIMVKLGLAITATLLIGLGAAAPAAVEV